MPPGPPSTVTSTKTLRCELRLKLAGTRSTTSVRQRRCPTDPAPPILLRSPYGSGFPKATERLQPDSTDALKGVQMGMTMGVPVAFFNDKQLRASFLGVARRAWTFYCKEGLLDSAVSIEKARRVLQKHPVALSTISNHEVQDWIDHRATVAVKSPIDILR